MTWTRYITHNREGLLRLIAALLVMAGVSDGKPVQTLPRHLHSAILRLLRPAEEAARRLFMMVLRDMKVALGAVRKRPCPASIPKGSGARNPSFSLCDPLVRVGVVRRKYAPANGPRISFPGWVDPVFEPPAPQTSPDDQVGGARLTRRMLALQAALKDVKRQARRMARWRLKHPQRRAPFRLGRPPSLRPKRGHEVDEILSDCHALALQALRPPDTS